MDDQPVVAQTPHHVEIDVGGDVGERHGGISGETGRSHQSEFLAGPEREDDAPAAGLHRRQHLRQAHDHRRPRGVVVRAIVDFAFLVLVRERTRRTAADVIVVGAH